ncbi:MAG: site-specific DNA-methyltransferase [Clostridia bacterium]|nr:site-specific DNA-methyltransferase [Clostridia bacterium]
MRAVACQVERCQGEGPGGWLWQARLPDCAQELLDAYVGQVQTVYIDPPFCTGQRFEMRMRVGEKGWRTGSPRVTLPAYDDVWPDEASYFRMMDGVLETARGLLCPEGTLFLHVDPRKQAPLRLALDRIFGPRNFLNEIIWAYQSGGRATRHFSRKHDVILFYRKSAKYFFDIKAVPVPRGEQRSNHMRRVVDEQGRSYRTINSGGKQYVYYDDEPTYPGDVWQDVSHLQQKDPQRTGYDTQKPVALLDRIIRSASRPGDLVADLCFGSGTTLVAAARAGRRFLGVDCGAAAHGVARKRLLGWAAEHRTLASEGEEALDAELYSAIGFYRVSLREFTSDGLLKVLDAGGRTLTGLEAIDQWSVGFVREREFGREFVSLAHGARSAAKPELPTELEMPMLSGEPALCTVDLLGRKRVYIWEGHNA